MNDGFVVDSLVDVSWVTPSQSSLSTVQLLDRVASGMPFVVPAHWAFEVMNALIVLKRRRRIASQQYDSARLVLSHLTPVIDDDGPRLAFSEIPELAERYSLSAYDAAHLELTARAASVLTLL